MTTEAASAPQAGDVLELTAGEVVHGGWCVSRQDDTARVIFVRHALPGERVLATVTQATARFARADATEILRPSADRVTPPCPYARPGGCGGCDWQHASLPAQRALKAAVIRQQLSRIGGIDIEVEVEALDGDEGGLGWRTVVSFAVDASGMAGLRKHRSHEIVEIERCLIAHELVTATDVTGKRWPGAQSAEVSVAPATGERGVLVTGPATDDALPEIAADSVQLIRRSGARMPVRGRGYLTQRAAGRDWRVSLGSFWQVHPGAADALAAAVLAAADPQPGDTALDLYCGAGLFAGVLAEAVGPDGAVIAVEQDPGSVRDARHNLRAWPWAQVHAGDVAAVLRKASLGDASIAVLDPPRAGASKPVIDALCGRGGSRENGSALRRIAYVSCDPATLARDLRLLLDAGWQLAGLRGYDAFPMTHHVECVATLVRD
ncbi:MAG TPA: class I SAM-dependent RNA methyltransferase [Streptosporangiaceae bacterium]|nr:class I SAM-dependent RNA methyltransferase [Streptosporangiaceae bacterium]